MGNLPPSGVAVKTRTGTRVAVIVGSLLILGLAAYGFGFGFIGSDTTTLSIANQPSYTAYTAGNVNKTVSAVPAAVATCNVAENGGGRCYPACRTDSDCGDKNGATSAWETCKTKAKELCGLSDSCVAMICGGQPATCRQGFCTRPNLALSLAQCAAGATPIVNKCKPEGGKCYKICAADDDCAAGAAAYKTCVQNLGVKAECQLARGATDEKCVIEKCGAKPAVKSGACLKGDVASRCAEPLAKIASQSACEVGTSPTTVQSENVWISTCSQDGKECRTDANCLNPKGNPGNWVGLCPSNSALAEVVNGPTVSNCTGADVSKCRVPGEPPATPTCSPLTGRCYPGCVKNADCLDGKTANLAECTAKAKTICGESTACVDRICGPAAPVCRNGSCSRPNFALSQSQCQATATGTNKCNLGGGKCYKVCAADADCAATSATYASCVNSAAVKKACQINAADKPYYDPSCLKEKCGSAPTAPAGSCVSEAGVKHCKTATANLTTSAACAPTGADTLAPGAGNVWLGACSDGKICRTDSDCGTMPAGSKWLGLCAVAGQTGSALLSAADCASDATCGTPGTAPGYVPAPSIPGATYSGTNANGNTNSSGAGTFTP